MPLPAILLALAEATVVRQVVMAIVSGIAFEIGSNLIEPAFEKLKDQYKAKEGLSEDDAWDKVMEWVLELVGGSLVVFIALRKRLPMKIADRVVKYLGSKIVKGETVAVAQAVVASAGTATAKTAVAGAAYSKIMNTVGVSALVYMGFINTIDFANWEGAYQKTFQAIFTKLGFPPDAKMPKAYTLSADTWKRVSATIEELGPTEISLPWLNVTLPYTVENLVAATDHVSAKLAADGQQATYKTVIGLLLPLIKINGKPTSAATGSSNTSGSSASSGTSATKQPVTIQIVTGVVANGTLGAEVSFTERQDDLIVSSAELKDAAKNNLTSFVTSLPGLFYYEIAIVSSVKTKGGFTQKGAANKIISSYASDGSPRYKTIYNKFAVMRVFIMDSTGKRIKLRDIVLGPVDAVAFQPTSSDLANVAGAITPELFTNDVSTITGIVTSSPITVTPPKTTTPTVTQVQTSSPAPAGGNASATTPASTPASSQTPSASAPVATVQYSAPAGPVAPPPVDPRITKGLAATNLSEYYAAFGQEVPALSQRANLYQSWGLGQASLYTGTAEQNTKMLAHLKAQWQ